MKNSIAVAIILFVVYGVFLEFGPKPAQIKTQSQWQNNQLFIEKFFRAAKTPEVVFVGSSLAERLDFNGGNSCVYNLALGGDSVLTGLSVIAMSGRKPGTVFVEINVPERGINKDLIEKTSGVLQGLSSMFYVENMPVNLVYSFLSPAKKNSSGSEANEAVLRNALSLQRQGYRKTLTSATLEKSLAEFRSLTGTLESKGIKVVFFEMPVHPDLENTPRALQIRAAFRQAFPGNKFIGAEVLSEGLTIKTMDGVHLLPDEAKKVVLILQGYYKDACVN